MLPWCRIDTVLCACQHPRFVVEQPLLDRQPAAEAGQGTVRADDAMAGEHDTNRIRSVRGADRSSRGRDAEPGRLTSVGRGGPEWNLRQRAPGRHLEARALEIEGMSNVVRWPAKYSSSCLAVVFRIGW